jgi:hypothetical protein
MDFHPADSDDDGDGVSGDVGDGAKDDGRKTLDEHMLIDKKVEAPNVLQLGTAPIFRSRPTSILSTPSPANNFLCFFQKPYTAISVFMPFLAQTKALSPPPGLMPCTTCSPRFSNPSL